MKFKQASMKKRDENDFQIRKKMKIPMIRKKKKTYGNDDFKAAFVVGLFAQLYENERVLKKIMVAFE